MCIRVRYASFCSRENPWDADAGVITVPDTLSPPLALRAVRTVLTELAVPQPDFGALCWCGAPVVLVPRVPEHRGGEEVIVVGA
jgi:hypothetical protein